MTIPSRLTLAGLVVLVLAAVALAGAARADTITVGRLTLVACRPQYHGYCGQFERPLDPSGHLPGRIRIGFEWYPRRDGAQPPLGTLAAQEGGPGYSTTGSRDGYVRMLDPLRDRRDILLMDKRGTGLSGAIDCPTLQGSASPTPADYAACGRQLGPAAWLYGTAFAADDLAALLDALGVAQIDYYGDSYGTFVGQVFAARHPARLRSLVLDSAYPVRGLTPWFASEYEEAPRALELSCARDPICRTLPGDPVARLDSVAASLRAHPLTGTAPGPDGHPRSVTADPPALFLLLDLAGNNPLAWRDFDAAARAFLQQGDTLPLLRLVAEAEGTAATANAPPSAFSGGLATAVICSDYPQPFDYAADRATRRSQFDRAVAAEQTRQPLVYAPFTVADALAAPFQPIGAAVCLDWPAPPRGIVPGQPAGTMPFANVPVLVINGGLDTVTSPDDGRHAAALFPAPRFVLVANAIHETAIGDGGVFVPPFGGDLAQCASPIVRRFLASGGDPGSVACAARVRPIRTVPAFARHAARVFAATALPGNEADAATLRIASAAAETVGDVIARYYVTLSGRGAGLRGGHWTLASSADGYDFSLHGLRWSDDLAVSGTIRWNQQTGRIEAQVALAGAAAGTLVLHWNDRRTDAICAMAGSIDGQVVAAERLAP